MKRQHAMKSAGLLGVVLLCSAQAGGEPASWSSAPHPYRLTLKLERSVSQPAVLALDAQAIINAIAPVAVDQLNQDTLAFERAVLVNPHTGATVGRFRLMDAGPPLDIDGSFERLREGRPPWLGFRPERMRFQSVRLDDRPRQALMIREEAIANVRISQTVRLEPNRQYLLDYWIMCDPSDSHMDVMLHHPDLTLFSPVYHSYVMRMPPPGRWQRERVLFRPQPTRAGHTGPLDIDLRITHAFIGQGGVAAMSLRPVAWRLVVEPDRPLEELVLYVSARAGHRMTVPTDELIARTMPRHTVNAVVGVPRVQTLNEGAVRVASGDVVAWTIDPSLPLKVQTVQSYRPDEGAGAAAARVDVFHGGSTSLVIALKTRPTRLDDLQADSDLPADVTFHRLATIPVYDGPTVRGELKGALIETRYDAMVPLDYPLDPDGGTGVHLVVATITPRSDTPAGAHEGRVRLSFAGTSLAVPVTLRCAPLHLRPSHHFGTLFGAQAYLIARSAGTANMVEDAISIAAFHGMDDAASNLPAVRALAERYFHALLDHHLAPRGPALYHDFTYTVSDRGPGRAPRLSDWDFSGGYDGAVEEFVIGRDIPWFAVFHTNGHLMHQLRLRNGTTYSVAANPDDPHWVQLPRQEFDKLIGDYFDGIARYLDARGVLDRAILVIDESGSETYDDIRAWVMAMRDRPYAARIKIGHTIYKTTPYTMTGPGGGLLMDDLLDVPMPINDDHFNFFEPQWRNRFQRPKTPWVYHVETDHMNLENAGLSTMLLPMKLRRFGVAGWYCWESFMWSLPYAYVEGERGSMKYGTGPVGNPWVNPFYHHGPGVLSFFYPPDPRGPADEPTNLVIPSYRLALMRDGIQQRALVEALRAGRDDAGAPLRVDAERLERVEAHLATLWADNPVQWHLDYSTYRDVRRELFDMAMEVKP